MIGGRELQTVKSMGLTAILASNLFLFVPLVLYVGNPEEFALPFSTILGSYIRPAILLIMIFGLAGMILPASIFRRYLIFLAAISVLLWFQGNILVWDYGPLNGRGIDWARNSWRGWIDLGIWFSVILTAIFFHRRAEKPIMYFAIATFSLQLALSLFIGMQNVSVLTEKAETGHSTEALTQIRRFSASKNVLHIILDGFQSDIFNEIVYDGEVGARFRAALKGFVFFKDNMGVFPFTHMTVPAIVSGQIYRNHMPTHEFIDKTMSGKTILNAAHNAGYEIDLAAPVPLLSMYTKGKYTNAHLIYELNDTAKLFDLALFRLVPHFLKKYVYNDQLWLVQPFLNDSKYVQLVFFAHKAFLRKLNDNMLADRPVPVYKLFHVMLSHDPIVANRQCQYAGRVLPVVRATVKIQARCGLIEVVGLLERMKEVGIYDDALIILQADHGAWVEPAGLITYADPEGNTVQRMDPTTVGMALPLLAIKQPGANGALSISTSPSSIVDTPATIASVLGLREEFDGISVFDLRPNELRERRYYGYLYSRREWTTEYLSPLQELIVKGSVLDSKAWRPGLWFHPKGVVKQSLH